MIVEPADTDYWAPAHRELCLTLDDVLLEDGRIAPFSRLETNHAAMGRFGDTLLIAGEPEVELTAKQGEVVRIYLTNTANTRVFKVALPGARMKLVGGDSGRVEQEELIEDVVLAPSERAVVDVLFDQPGELVLEHRTPGKTYRLGPGSSAPRAPRCASPTAPSRGSARSSGRRAFDSTTPSCTCPSSPPTAASSTAAASPACRACTSWACRGSTRADRRCWAGSKTTRGTSPSGSPSAPRAA